MQQKSLHALLLLTIAILPIHAQRTYDCGNLNQRSCKSSDWEYVNMQLGRSRGCEPDLKNQDGFCRNENRNTTLIRNPFWSGWANENQLLSIGRDTPINFITWPASHNVYSNSRQGFNSVFYTNHVLTITDQLNFGYRHLELDPKHFTQLAYIPYPPFFIPIPTPLGDTAIRLCHAYDVGLCAQSGYGNRLFGFALKEIADWIDANPGQVIYIKIDNVDLDSKMQEMFNEITNILGSRLYPLPANMTRWPTIREIRNAGKSIVVAYHNRSTTSATSAFVYNAAGLMQADNHPKDQNFTTCVAHDGLNPTERSIAKPLSWWDTAEGRAKTNSGNSSTGLFWQDTVEKATNCGVSAIGLDFISALDSSYNVSQSDDADLRINRMIWSWRENDFGNRGPAYQDPTAGRWVSNPATAAFPVACAIIRPYGSPLQDRQWKVTSTALPWSKPLGDAQCRAEFGQDYEFAFPTNGWQNQKLREVAAGRKIWMGYTLGPIDSISLSTNAHVFRMNPNGALPPALQVRVAAAPGTLLEGKITGSIPATFDLPSNALASGDYTFPISILPSAANLPSGTYSGLLELSYRVPYSQSSVPVQIQLQLVVRSLPSLSAVPGASTIRQGLPVTLSGILSGASNPTGDMKFYRIADQNGVSVGQETVGFGSLLSGNNLVKIEVNTLPLGRNTYSAFYSGDRNNLGAESEPFTIEVTPRLIANPAIVTISAPPGVDTGARLVQIANLGANAAASTTCNWLKVGITGSSLSVRVQGDGLNFGLGSYSCTVTVRDALTTQGQGEASVPVVLNVQTTLSANPGSVSLFGNSPADTTLAVNAAGGANIRVEAASNQPWLLAEFIQGNSTPATLRIVADPATLPAGNSSAQIVISSPLAPSITIPVTFNKVNRTIVTSTPAGRLVTVDGSQYTTPAEFVWQAGTQHSISAASPQIDNGTRYAWTTWTINGSPVGSQPFQYTATSAGATITAGFDATYALTTDAAPSVGGSIQRSVTTPTGYYLPGQTVQLTAQPSQGYTFSGWLGDLSGNNATGTVTMNGPRNVVANFTQTQAVPVYFYADAPGATLVVNGSTYPLPVTLQLTPGQTYSVTAAQFVNGPTGTRFQFLNWSDGGALTHNITGPTFNAEFMVRYQRQYLLTALGSPQNGGTVSGGGWHNEGATVGLQATANPSFSFSGFSGDLTGTNNPATLVMSAPRNVVANFGPAAGATLLVGTGGARSNGSGLNERIVPIRFTNTSSVMAQNVRITGITGIATLLGSGSVSLVTPTPTVLGNIGAGNSADVPLVFLWPSTAQRVRLTVNYSLDNGTPASTTLTLFR